MDRLQVVATLGVATLALGGMLALVNERLVLSGTLFVFTAFAIYLREIRTRERTG